MLEHRGYRIVRYFHEMQRPLPGPPIALTAQPVQPYRAELAEQVRLAHNDAFSTHWDSTARSAEAWQAQLASRTLRADASFVSTDADGSVAAYVLARQWVDGELWVDLVGSRQSARGQGLARACLSASLRAAAEQGYRSAALSVDSENGQGAGRLYSSLGFEVVRVVAMYAKVFTG
jgi:ribosomal protein S18 acetylase RimI-like enzyme